MAPSSNGETANYDALVDKAAQSPQIPFHGLMKTQLEDVMTRFVTAKRRHARLNARMSRLVHLYKNAKKRKRRYIFVKSFVHVIAQLQEMREELGAALVNLQALKWATSSDHTKAKKLADQYGVVHDRLTTLDDKQERTLQADKTQAFIFQEEQLAEIDRKRRLGITVTVRAFEMVQGKSTDGIVRRRIVLLLLH